MSADGAQHLRAELDRLIGTFQKESEKHKGLYRKLRYLIFSLTGCSTVLASLALSFKEIQPWLNIGVVLASVAASIVTSIEGLRKPSELWILERNVFHALRDLKREIDYKAAEAPASLNFDAYFDRLQTILSASTEKWTRQLQQLKKAE